MQLRILRHKCFVIAWVTVGFASWVTPLIMFIHSRLTHHLPDNYKEYVKANDDVWGSYFGNSMDDDDVRWKNYQDNNCSWLLGCSYQGRHTSTPQPPRWWLGSEDDSYELSTALRAALCLVYIGSSVMFAGILYFGYQTTQLVRNSQFQTLQSLLPVLLVFALFSLLTMVLISSVGGMVDTWGKDFLQYGWFGQLGILLSSIAVLLLSFEFRRQLPAAPIAHEKGNLFFSRKDHNRSRFSPKGGDKSPTNFSKKNNKPAEKARRRKSAVEIIAATALGRKRQGKNGEIGKHGENHEQYSLGNSSGI
eukprot:scaffold3077_cov162-Amphora_coffeaeformis.AAC.29